MTKVFTDRKFEKRYKQLPQTIREKFLERVQCFLDNPRDPHLNIHKLQGKKKHLTSMNVTGNYRALFLQKDKETIVFYEIGTHAQLYG